MCLYTSPIRPYICNNDTVLMAVYRERSFFVDRSSFNFYVNELLTVVCIIILNTFS